MTCEGPARSDTLERYVAGQLDEEAMAAVERHVFECEDCASMLDELTAIRTVLAELPPAPAHSRSPHRQAPRWYSQPWAIAASTAVLMFAAAGAVWWTRGAPVPAQARVVEPSGPASGPSTPEPVAPAPAASSHSTTAPASSPDATTEPDWARLARFEAPALLALTLRGAEAPAGDNAALEEARHAYARRRFAEAADLFTRAASGGEAPAEIAFYRGVSYLKSGAADKGLADLDAAAASNQAPYAVEAHLYLAYGHLARHDSASARAALDRYVALDGDFTADARRLIRNLPTPAPRSH